MTTFLLCLNAALLAFVAWGVSELLALHRVKRPTLPEPPQSWRDAQRGER